MRFIGVEVEQETSVPLLKKILDPPLIQTTVSQVTGVRGCRRNRQLSF